MSVAVTNWGARVEQILVRDRAGTFGDVALGYDSLEAARSGQPSMGAFIGRYANRIANGKFVLDGKSHQLSTNSGPHTLHGGTKGLRFVVLDVTDVTGDAVTMRYTFADGEEGFPGTLELSLTYRVTPDDALEIAYEAKALDRATVANFTPHGFFNLAGHDRGDVLDHLVQVNASRFLPVDASLIPTGELRPVDGTPLDLRTPTRLRDRIDLPDEQLQLGKGFDHHYVLDRDGASPSLAARVTEPASGRVVDVWTTEPGMQFFTGNHLTGLAPRDSGKEGALYGPRAGLCLEPSGFPDAPNHPGFPSTVVRPGHPFRGVTLYRFSVAP